jgi:hypothetical protein
MWHAPFVCFGMETTIRSLPPLLLLLLFSYCAGYSWW